MPAPSYQERQEAISDIPHDAYWVIGTLAVYGYPLSSYTVEKVLTQLNIRCESPTGFTYIHIREQLLWLQRNAFIAFYNTEPVVRIEWREAIARHFVTQLGPNHKRFFRALNKHLPNFLLKRSYLSYSSSSQELERRIQQMRLAFFEGKYAAFQEQKDDLISAAYYSNELSIQVEEALLSLFFPFDEAFLERCPLEIRAEAIGHYLQQPHLWGHSLARPLGRFYRKTYLQLPTGLSLDDEAYAQLLIWQGTPSDELSQSFNLEGKLTWQGLHAIRMLQYGEWAAAVEAFLALNRRTTNDGFSHITGIFAWLCLLHTGETDALPAPEHIERLAEGGRYKGAAYAMAQLCRFLVQGETQPVPDDLPLSYYADSSPLDLLFILWAAYWTDAPSPLEPGQLERLNKRLVHWEQTGLPWIAGEMANLLYHVAPEHPNREAWALQAETLASKYGFRYLLGLFQKQPQWRKVLQTLESIAQDSLPGAPKPVGSTRLVWFVNFEEEHLQPKEQKRSKRGGWSAGRKVDLADIEQERVDSLTSADKKVLQAVDAEYFRSYYYSFTPSLHFAHALYLLAGHPYVFLDMKGDIPIELVRSTPELLITEEPEGLKVIFRPSHAQGEYVYEKETPTRYRVYNLSDAEVKAARSVGKGAILPPDARPRLEAITQVLKQSLHVQSPADLLNEELPLRQGDPTPCLHLLPFGEGYKLEFYVKPLAGEPHYFKPGEGAGTRTLLTQSGKVACQRALEEEAAQAQAVIMACPSLAAHPAEHYEWQIEDVEACLHILLELHPLRQEGLITLEHPKGEKVRLAGISGMSQLTMRIEKERDWFAVDGSLQVHESEVMAFQQLLQHVRQSDSPFVALKNGDFVALTEAFRDRLREMDAMLNQRGKKLELNPLAGLRLDEIAGEMAELDADRSWAEAMQRIQQAQRIRPRVPSQFDAKLRSYQKDGFRWMMRLAEWGVGGCLADDMGLGKTVQALAMLTARREEGPALVIAPASVTRNWVRETNKFAPTLTPYLLGSSKEAPLIQSVGPGDLLMVSYGLLPFVEAELLDKTFGTIVLDEAQAIKNASTKRSQITMELQGKFRLATTGTPIENHLGELWNLFRFLNPGLLGSQKQFNEKYANPIGRGDEARREQLRRLIQPFILRRRKKEVLTELPAKTEVVLNVSLSEAEMAFYEALRRNALDAIAAADDQSKRFAVLAQLTKLRQAACHPRLAEADSRLGSSKLELVGDTILELLENGHKALIFSQFVKHLRIVEQWVKNQGISYQYLDGQTPGKKREAAVQAFQNGEGDVFLISLKAGGTGLNLTEADYVLHLDPWWNPAVEDQASDRAHRIGQQRPVTVYRFVSEATIEEKIVQLHAEKRELADQLLSGTDVSAKLSVNEMLELLKA
ncbi:DEAD/DEAH box helicase [Phaeodactylibacter luteus]|uniref:DEAD/DEAH box helicase n=1 Tax=Phaeodactylibacter luteus TaxID=1564516 RepID=A0A5C6RJR3_9BACT|nr:DEAD/DEAH box helicase [Phaeodactylibacter luteus]TXB62403.1 DEAD/DEAH box helicase [Phaeodactylibacter luteus]